MAKRIPILFLGLLLATTACERPTPPSSAGAEASFDLTAYLRQQKQHLQTTKPMVLKSATTENNPTETIETDEIDWNDELAVFEETDINRPSLQEYYTKEEQVLGDGSRIVEYNKVEGAEPLVHYLRLSLSPDRKLRQLNALIQDQNVLFYSRRNVQLTADPASGNLSGYRVEGIQKLVLSDSLRYRIDANL